MNIGEKRRIYIAGILAKMVEYVISILVIGYFVSIKLNPQLSFDYSYLLLAAFFAIIIMSLGAWVTPEKED